MKIRQRRLITGFLGALLAVSMFCMPAAAAVESGVSRESASEIGEVSESVVKNDSFITGSTASQTPVDLSGATWKKVGNHLRLRNSDGSYKKGFVKHNGKLYFFDSKGNLKTGFFTYKGKQYFASNSKGEKGKGQILTGIVKINRYYYYLSVSSSPYPGAVAKGSQKISGRRYYFNSNGHMITGWFTVGGSKYYASCNKKRYYGALLTGIQKIGNKYYKLDSNGKLIGTVSAAAAKTGTAAKPASSSGYEHMLDVSEHQGSIDFKKVRASGVTSVIIRAGYGKSTVDKYFHQNIKNAQAAGLSVGIYWFSYAGTRQQAIEEAKFCLRTISPYKISLPVFFDWEYDSMRYTKVRSRDKITDMTAAFCGTITNGGRRAGYYFNLQYLNNYYNPAKLTQYSTWYAYWGSNKPGSNVWAHAYTMAVPKQYNMWQFTSRGKIPGIKGNVDCDLLLSPSIKR